MDKQSREAVKVLCKSVGIREGARRMGLSEERVLKWSQRDPAGPWIKQETSSLTVQEKRCPQPVRNPSEALQSVLEDDNRQTKLSLSKGVRRLAKHIETMPEPVLFAGAANVKQAVSSASQIHNWEKEEEGSGTLSGLRVYSKQTIMNVQVATAQPTQSLVNEETGGADAS